MITHLKNKVKGLLRKYNYVVQHIAPNNISGVDLFRDMRLLVKTENPVCLDAGANRGQTIEMFQKSFKNPKIYAFEPSSEIFQILQSRKHGDQVSLHNFALGENNAKHEFINYQSSCLSSFLTLDAHEENRFRNWEIKSKEMVEVKTLDWFLQQYSIDTVDLLKIDTQGYDLPVLLGATESFQRGLIHNVFVELNFVRMYEKQSDAKEIIDFLAKYNIHLVDYYEKVRQHHTLAWCTALFTRR